MRQNRPWSRWDCKLRSFLDLAQGPDRPDPTRLVRRLQMGPYYCKLRTVPPTSYPHKQTPDSEKRRSETQTSFNSIFRPA